MSVPLEGSQLQAPRNGGLDWSFREDKDCPRAAPWGGRIGGFLTI